MWYFLISNSDSYIEIQGSYDRVRNIFFSNQREPIENLELTAIAQEGLTKEILLEVDYLEDVIMGGIPVFSARFKEVIQPHLNGEMDLMPYFKDNEKYVDRSNIEIDCLLTSNLNLRLVERECCDYVIIPYKVNILKQIRQRNKEIKTYILFFHISIAMSLYHKSIDFAV